MADVDRGGRLRLDAVARHLQDVGQDHVHTRGFDTSHPVGVVRRTVIDLIRPIEFVLRLRRWCSGTSTRWCQFRVRIEGARGGLIESEGFWININPDTGMPARISDDFLRELHRTTQVQRLRWQPYLSAGDREDADRIREYPLRSTDIDLFDHMNNAVYGAVVEDYLSTSPDLLSSPLRVTLEHEAPTALADKLQILEHTHSDGSTDRFGVGLADRAVTTLTYVVGDQTRAIAAIVAL